MAVRQRRQFSLNSEVFAIYKLISNSGYWGNTRARIINKSKINRNDIAVNTKTTYSTQANMREVCQTDNTVFESICQFKLFIIFSYGYAFRFGFKIYNIAI